MVNRILLVEDDPDLRPLLTHILIDGRFRVEATTTVAGALSMLETRSYDLVVADARLGDGNGMTIAAHAEEHGIKALIVTGYAFMFPHDELARYEYLLKPVRPNELLAAVARILGRPKAA